MIARSENIQDLCGYIHKGLQGFLGPLHASEAPQLSAGLQMTEGAEMSEEGYRERCWQKYGGVCVNPEEP